MYATVRRYEVMDKLRVDEITRKTGENLVPSLSELPGFAAYYLIDAGGGVLTSVGLFENAKEAHESTRIAARWVREQKLESAMPNPPKITAGPVITHESRDTTVTNGVPGMTSPKVLDWDAFAARYFPGGKRHDLDAVAAYGVYKQGRDWRKRVRRSTPPKLTLVPSDSVPATIDTEPHEPGLEHLLVSIAAEQVWEGEGGFTP